MLSEQKLPSSAFRVTVIDLGVGKSARLDQWAHPTFQPLVTGLEEGTWPQLNHRINHTPGDLPTFYSSNELSGREVSFHVNPWFSDGQDPSLTEKASSTAGSHRVHRKIQAQWKAGAERHRESWTIPGSRCLGLSSCNFLVRVHSLLFSGTVCFLWLATKWTLSKILLWLIYFLLER